MGIKKTVVLEGIKKGQFLSWFATTQAANTSTVKLYDNRKVYIEASKNTVNMNPPMAQGCAVAEGEGLTLEISSSGNCELRLRHFMADLTTDTGKSVGKTFTLVGEDYVDNDFNDICISVSAWNKTR